MIALTLIVALAVGVPRDTYSERWLCDLWAGARCYSTSCEKDAKERCDAVSRQCARTSHAQVDSAKAQAKATCARALLVQKCGEATPSACQGLL